MKKSLLLLVISCLVILFTSANSQTPDFLPTNDLVAWYPFNGNANDMSGNGHDGTVNGATLTVDRNGNPNSAYSFDGVNDNITAAQSIDFEISGDRTLSVWIYSNISPTNDQIIAGYIATSAPWIGLAGYMLVYRNQPLGNPIGAVEIDWANGNGGWAYTNTQVFPNNWKHVVSVRENGITSIYLNGVLQTNGTTNVTPSFFNNEFVIGQGTFYEYFNGTIDDVALWNRALTSQEIWDLYSGNTNVGINDHPDNNEFVIYPNPAVNEFFVKFQNVNNNPVAIELYDMSGKIIKSELLSKNSSSNYKFDTSNIHSGIYLTKVVFKNGDSTNKILNKL